MLTKPIMSGSGPAIDLSEVLAIRVEQGNLGNEYVCSNTPKIVFLFRAANKQLNWVYSKDRIRKMDGVEQAVLDLINNPSLKEL